MENQEIYQYEIVKKLSFPRFGGTAEELRAAQLIQGEIAAFGGKSELMDFNISAWDVSCCRLEVTAPFEREVSCAPYGLSGQLPVGGRELTLRYIEMNTPAAFLGLEDLSDSAVLVNFPLDMDLYRELVARKAAALLVITADKWYRKDTDFPSRAIRPPMLALGKIPAVLLSAGDALEMMRDGAKTVHVELRQTECEHVSRDVVAEIPGTEIGEESVVLTAHYDSVTCGNGSWDNATGSATLLYIYEHFLHNPPRRTMRFIWCGSEEQGLLGSKAYIKQHEDLLGSIRMCFNFDMCGTVLGRNNIHITGSEELKILTQALCDEAGYSANLQMGVHSSDSAPFADRGIPGVGLSRDTKNGEIHTRYDLLDLLSPEMLKRNGDFAIFFIRRFVDSRVFPVKREMPEDMVKELDKYFKRDKLAEYARLENKQ